MGDWLVRVTGGQVDLAIHDGAPWFDDAGFGQQIDVGRGAQERRCLD